MKLAVLLVVGILFRLLLLAGIAMIAAVDVTFLLPQSHGGGLALNALLLVLCVLLAWQTLRPVLAPRRDFLGRRRAPRQGAYPGERARSRDPELADTTWL